MQKIYKKLQQEVLFVFVCLLGKLYSISEKSNSTRRAGKPVPVPYGNDAVMCAKQQ